ncbi:sensor histidine kinase [Sphingomonas sp. LaA6.9]|uniref:sensor histidine kinase n=1 Tax=Sphingomonas sp. LaA6.9 TaxID=2919914 RepID=UPI001F4F89D2|nr:ATP-binding protein [Sphingomonas sp. LaA6.9]MCJ8158075.1 histidine kinase [Sphingomonas sp. LaA6.9]
MRGADAIGNDKALIHTIMELAMSDVAYENTLQQSLTGASDASADAFGPPVLTVKAGIDPPGMGWRARRMPGSLQGVIDAMPMPAAVIDEELRIAAVNDAWLGSFAPGTADTTGRNIIGGDFVTASAAGVGETRRAVRVRSGLRRLQSHRIAQFSHRQTVVLNGEARLFVVRTAPLWRFGRLLLASYVDVTDNKRRVTERRHYCLSLLRAEEEERKRIALELHDETAQQLALMQFALTSLKDAGNGAGVERACLGIEEALGAVQLQLRTLSYVLHPPELEHGGIESALRTFVLGFARRSGLLAEFEGIASPLNLSRDIEIAFYRVAQEALANVQRHAAASRVRVALKKESGDLVMEISDNGVGISAEIVSAQRREGLGVGLVGMRERLQALAGRLDICRLPLGTMVTARVPCRSRATG